MNHLRLRLLIGVFIIFRNSFALDKGSTNYEDKSFWLKSGQENLHKILSIKNNEQRAKNVIIFIGDGMGLSTVTAGRIFTGQNQGFSGEEYQLAFEKFPNTGLAKTYNVDRQVPDSAGTATAIFSGVKCRYSVIGFDTKARFNHCDKEVNEASKVQTIAKWAQDVGMDTGFVTSTRITHATPASLYAHINHRNWECDSAIPEQYKQCTTDIARQLVEQAPGKNFNVIMGGGGQAMGLPLMDAKDHTTCERSDGQNLTDVWSRENPTGKLVTNYDELMSIDIRNTSKIMGIFASSHMPYHAVKSEKVPSLANMTSQAIKLLKKNRKGFLLMVESGKIDLAHHDNYAKLALREVSELEQAILVALDNTNREDTLIIVTADHSHSFTMNGYPVRGADILGFADNDQNTTYETLSYANGPSFDYHRNNQSGNVNETWKSLENDPHRNDSFYRHFSGRYLKEETHGGEDVGVYAIGPYSHLIRGTFEQNYIAHVIAYAACFNNNWSSHCNNTSSFAHQSQPIFSLIIGLISFLFWIQKT